MTRAYTLSIFGLGRVGLSLAVCYASKGFNVIGVDVDKAKLKLLKKGKPPFYEPKLDRLLKLALDIRAITFTASHKEAVMKSDISFITVGTPSAPDGGVNLRFVKQVARQIGVALRLKEGWHLVVVRSTVPPGTTKDIIKPIIEDSSGKKCGDDFGLCMNPEFLSEGSAINCILKPDRIIIGEYDKRSGDALQIFYENFYGQELPPILRTNLVNAELIKYANNAFLAMKVSFANMIANLCQRLPGADVGVVMKGIGMDKRISPYFLRAGLGWGGSCWPKDLKALLKIAEKHGLRMPLIEATIEVNEKQPSVAIEMAKEVLGSLTDKKVAVLGLSFKPGTDDTREAVSLKVIRRLLDEGAIVVVYDPRAMGNARKIIGDSVIYAKSIRECLSGADCCIIITEWDEFRKLKPEDFIAYMRRPVIIDGRRIYESAEFKRREDIIIILVGTCKP